VSFELSSLSSKLLQRLLKDLVE